MTNSRICQRCGVRPASSPWISILGPIVLREDWHCRVCDDTMQAEAERRPAPAAHGVVDLGPIDFGVLRESIQLAEADPTIAIENFVVVAPLLAEIATAHEQILPDDILAFITRHSASSP